MNKKIILISGGSDGLGKAIAEKLIPNNQVIILAHNQKKLADVAAEIKCDYVFGDVTDYNSLTSAIDTVVSKYLKIDILINNAGIWMDGKLEDGDPKTIEEVINVNTLGTIFLTKVTIPHMKQYGGRIINIVSQDGLSSKANRSVYSASKWAITGFTKCLQEDLHGSNISVTGIYPGLLKTSLFEKHGAERDLSHALNLSEVSDLVEYVINLTSDTFIPDISIKNINNPNNMDDNSTPPIGLDINPDLITTSKDTPMAGPPGAPSSDPVSTNVIDITPGKISGPVGPIPNPLDISPVVQSPEPVTTAFSPPPAKSATADAPYSEMDAPIPGSHLIDMVPTQSSEPIVQPEIAPIPSLPSPESMNVTPDAVKPPSVTAPELSPLLEPAKPFPTPTEIPASTQLPTPTGLPTPTETPAPTAESAGIGVGLPQPEQPSQYHEDPDMVGTIK